MDAPRARSFGAVAAAYAAHRPGYPDEAIAWALAPAPGRHVLDLGAGTGKLTGSLGAYDVVAVEPDPAMLAQLRVELPAVDAREGSAEAIPLPDAAVDAVVVGQAWHWFDPDRALPEIARVLRPGGVLAVIWNGEDDRVEWVRGYRDLLGHHHGQGRQDAADRRLAPTAAGPPAPLPEYPAFMTWEHHDVPHPIRTTAQGLLSTIATHSWALVAEPADREAAFARLRAYFGSRPETSGADGFVLPLVTDVLRVLRR